MFVPRADFFALSESDFAGILEILESLHKIVVMIFSRIVKYIRKLFIVQQVLFLIACLHTVRTHVDKRNIYPRQISGLKANGIIKSAFAG